METFWTEMLSLPTAFFGILLVVSVLYWLISLLGAFDLDMDLDVDLEGMSGLGGLMATLGLSGVPLPLTMTVMTLGAWLSSYFLGLLLGHGLLVGSIVAAVSIVVGLVAAIGMARLLGPAFRHLYSAPRKRNLQGETAVVVSFSADRGRGRARVRRDGAELVINIQSDSALERRDQVVLIRHLPEQRAYWVVTEHQFLSGDME
ncbi:MULTISPECIES: hypothetical protein [Halomonas]|uniref:Ubiquinone biosynthesis protein UbiH n=1 Tax=Halomonas halophila TaxID=29573 RepID=A0ABQ0U7U4_9GAMM|nr:MULTISPECIES: hypothetical protein [Halomonas]MDR5891048.1 hypothetical protein [Halomonas salina]WJY06976.1 hypothetical protein QWG60_14980 [Halomonas halophila]GEK74553.1 hypothetical protein HHA04nite_30970 [Halomonas halophila]